MSAEAELTATITKAGKASLDAADETGLPVLISDINPHAPHKKDCCSAQGSIIDGPGGSR